MEGCATKRRESAGQENEVTVRRGVGTSLVVKDGEEG